jgi:hypothetical protein
LEEPLSWLVWEVTWECAVVGGVGEGGRGGRIDDGVGVGVVGVSGGVPGGVSEDREPGGVSVPESSSVTGVQGGVPGGVRVCSLESLPGRGGRERLSPGSRGRGRETRDVCDASGEARDVCDASGEMGYDARAYPSPGGPWSASADGRRWV